MTVFTETAIGSDAHALWIDSRDARGQLPLPSTAGPRVAVLLIGDGRDAVRAATLASFRENVYGYLMTGVVQVDDRQHQLGFAGAIEAGWAALRARAQAARRQGNPPPFDYVLHLEEDWEFLRSVDVRDLSRVLDNDPTVVQCALLREPVNETERLGGGIIASWPSEYAELLAVTRRPMTRYGSTPYLRHSLFFTTNPSLYRRSLVESEAWPQEPRSEDAMTRYLTGRGFAFAYLGERDDEPLIRHTGERTGLGY